MKILCLPFPQKKTVKNTNRKQARISVVSVSDIDGTHFNAVWIFQSTPKTYQFCVNGYFYCQNIMGWTVKTAGWDWKGRYQQIGKKGERRRKNSNAFQSPTPTPSLSLSLSHTHTHTEQDWDWWEFRAGYTRAQTRTVLGQTRRLRVGDMELRKRGGTRRKWFLWQRGRS